MFNIASPHGRAPVITHKLNLGLVYKRRRYLWPYGSYSREGTSYISCIIWTQGCSTCMQNSQYIYSKEDYTTTILLLYYYYTTSILLYYYYTTIYYVNKQTCILRGLEVWTTRCCMSRHPRRGFACRTRAKMPAASGAAALVPVCRSVHSLRRSVDRICSGNRVRLVTCMMYAILVPVQGCSQ